jgi:hypothetical protein
METMIEPLACWRVCSAAKASFFPSKAIASSLALKPGASWVRSTSRKQHLGKLQWKKTLFAFSGC